MRNSAIPKANRTELKRYIDFLRAKGLKDASIDINLYALKYFLEALGNKNLKKVKKEDIVDAIRKIQTAKRSKAAIPVNSRRGPTLSANTIEHIKSSVKRFYKHVLGNDEEYPHCVAWIRQKQIQNKLVKEELLTEQEALEIIKHCKNLRDKAIVNLLIEGGMRIGELLNIKLQDINLYMQPAHIRLDGKTGVRQIGIVTSKRALMDYLETVKDLKPDEVIWRGDTRYNLGRPVSNDAVRSAISKAAKAAGITKRVNPHSFRHASATINAVHMKEMVLKKYYGWSPRSTMTGLYVHLSDDDTDDAVLKRHGMEVPDRKVESAFKPWFCTVCIKGNDKVENTADAEFCSRCKSPRDMRVIWAHEDEITKLRDQVKLLQDINKLNNPEDVNKLIDGKTVEQIQKEREATEYFKAHQEEIMQEYVNNVVYPQKKEAYEEHTKTMLPEDRKKYEEWVENVQQIIKRREDIKSPEDRKTYEEWLKQTKEKRKEQGQV